MSLGRIRKARTGKSRAGLDPCAAAGACTWGDERPRRRKVTPPKAESRSHGREAGASSYRPRFAGPGNSGDIPSLHHSGDLGRMARGGSGVAVGYSDSLLMSAFDWVQRPNVRQRMKHDRGVPSHRLCPALGGRPDRIALRRCHNRPVRAGMRNPAGSEALVQGSRC